MRVDAEVFGKEEMRLSAKLLFRIHKSEGNTTAFIHDTSKVETQVSGSTLPSGQNPRSQLHVVTQLASNSPEPHQTGNDRRMDSTPENQS
jgi:hypothetical protein